MSAKLSREQIVAALLALEAECARREIAGEICIYGGAEMVLVFDARNATRDIDAVFRPKAEIRDAAQTVAEENGLPADWLNDGVKGFLSHNEQLRSELIPELEGLTHLRVVWPTPEYLLAMKCIAARSEETSEDRSDVEFLIRKLKLEREEKVLDIVGQFYPLDLIPVRTRYFINEILSALRNNPEEHDRER